MHHDPPKRPLLRLVLRIVAAVVLLTLVAILIFVGRQEIYFRQALARAEAAGLPTTFDEVNALYPMPPPGDNAAPLYAKADELFGNSASVPTEERRNDWTSNDLPVFGNDKAGIDEPWTAANTTATEDFIAHYAEIYALLDEAATKPDCRFIDDFALGFELQYNPYHGNLSKRAGLRQLQFEWAIAVNRPADAVRALENIATLGEHALGDPVLHGIQQRWMIVGTARNCVAQFVQRAPFDGDMLHAISDAYAYEPPMNTPADALASVLPAPLARQGLDRFPLASSPTVSDPFLRIASNLKKFMNGQPVDLGPLTATGSYAAIADWETRMIAAWDAPYPEALDNAESLAADFAASPSMKLFTRNMVEGYEFYPRIFAHSLADARLIRTLCAIERYHLVNDALPRNLEALVPTYLETVPIDPFDGQPLRYVPLNTTDFEIYSIGINRTDDNGQSSPHSTTGDIVIEIRR